MLAAERARARIMTVAKGSLHCFKSDAAAGTDDEKFGHVRVILVFHPVSTSSLSLIALAE
jgi:hypothetical protein